MSNDVDCGDGRELPPSPVPSDEHLWPGELPFTAWGQWDEDRLDVRVFLQGTWWVDRHQTPHQIVDMSDEHVANVIAFLVKHDNYFHRELAVCSSSTTPPTPSRGVPQATCSPKRSERRRSSSSARASGWSPPR